MALVNRFACANSEVFGILHKASNLLKKLWDVHRCQEERATAVIRIRTESLDEGAESAAAKEKKHKKHKAHPKARDVQRGSVGRKHDAIFVKDTPPLDPEAADEGLHILVQAGTCRRGVLTKIYSERKLLAAPHQSAIKRGVVDTDVQMR
ncbi:hypothetical protein B0H17DRAFT_1147896 [Mycena rosella]|uniref:Uncharacterized protein n=1 Tax=Mycena rosella TaxID=1033263 RepID=A0AAD7FXU3_MYCRO|nr:hypothetical protein B0H17DRAFT_1147896 [Mycena rosella]